ncbi:MAG: hypothetical protein COV07_01205 [Candidatus Vogelbacteria bacterium CG10_big_fil_rev_8_21_14_0_10_45_14]|uniref:Uncharacterized protein n=1 Tax=Candidatus Vogelbacteria bacterium CG10_big_fil_rev_8_21_14_0_10_45_14 TaxID=1975042 RepID=A0A2H0RKE9_9BACT|nr:MAG: hypothetical protein COV07_01205 [Candidatus Vogelbacteria bacterium CG10_big_fil_rev_8_21_14_0_10_45_14]
MNKISRFGGLVALSLFVLPMVANAQGATIETVILDVTYLLSLAVPLLITLALVYFIWGLGEFIFAGASDETKRAEGRNRMIWGIIALFVIVSVWGLVGIVARTFSIDQTSTLRGDQVPLVENPFE